MSNLKMSSLREAELRNICTGRLAANERQRWDAIWTHPNGNWFMRNCYADGLHDGHVASALRKIFRSTGRCN